MENVNTGAIVNSPAAGDLGQGGSASQQTAINNQGAQQQAAQPDQSKEITVPLHVVEAVRNELKDTKTQAQTLREQMQQIQALQQFGGGMPQQQQAQSPTQSQTVEDPLSGMEDDDLLSVNDMRKIITQIKTTSTPDPNLTNTIAKMQVQMQDPNYETTIRTYLPEMVASQPILREMITRAPNPLAAALSVAKMSPRYIQGNQQQQLQQQGGQQQQGQNTGPRDVLSDLQRIIENATKPGNPGAVGGGGAVSGFDRFRNMPDADFDAEVNRVLNGG